MCAHTYTHTEMPCCQHFPIAAQQMFLRFVTQYQDLSFDMGSPENCSGHSSPWATAFHYVLLGQAKLVGLAAGAVPLGHTSPPPHSITLPGKAGRANFHHGGFCSGQHWKEMKVSISSHAGPRPSTNTTSCLPHSVGQNQLQGSPGNKEWGRGVPGITV